MPPRRVSAAASRAPRAATRAPRATARRRPAAAAARSFFRFALPADLTSTLLWAAGGAGLFATLVGWLAPFFWGFALFEHFRIQYAALALLLAIAAALLRRPFQGILAGIVVLVNVAAIASAWLQPELPAHHGAPLKLLELNVMRDNRDHARVAKLLAASDADVVGLIEVDSKWLRDLAPALLRWPYQLRQPHDRDRFGMALFSKRPFRFREATTFGAQTVAITATVEMDGMPVTLVLIHPPPALDGEAARRQHEFYEALASKRPFLDEHVVVFGDFNATPWSYALRHLRGRTGLNDQRRGFDLGTSWPAKLVPWRIPIDQVMVSPRVVVLSRDVGDAVGSDHFPVVTEVALVK